MSKHRSAILIAAALGLWLALPPRALTGGLRASDPVIVQVAPPDTLAAFYADRYGIDAELAGTIHRLAIENGLEPAAVFGLIATESRFDTRAVGRSGAVGLMQIKPSTARAYDPHVTRERLFNPHWGEQVTFRPDNALAVALVFQGLDAAAATELWRPFVAWLAEIDETAAAAKASEILRRAANELGALSAEDAPPIGASVGIAMVSTAGAEDVEGLIARADDAMYAAKRGGKHRFVVAPAPDAAAAE